jgi:hypothetical protein
MGLQTSYVLELGTDTSYGTSISGEVGASSEAVGVSVPVIQLAPGTTYHYRFLAINPDGRIYGQDQTFQTPPYEHPIVLPRSEPLLGTPSIAFPTISKEGTAPEHKRKAAHKRRPKARGKKRRRHRAGAHTRNKRG